MISVNRRAPYGQVYNDVRCLSTDEKPTKDIRNGSVLYEIDTGDTYLFDAGSRTWHKQPTGGGGGVSLSPITVERVHEITGAGE